MDDDLNTLRRVAAGDEQALTELMGRHREAIFRLCWRYAGNEADARELCEATFARVYFNAGRFKPRASVKTWIFTIAANLCRDFLRRRKKHVGLISLSGEWGTGEGLTLEQVLPDPARDAAADAAGSERLEEIRHAITELPEKLRFPFIFCVLEEQSHEAAAEIMGVSPKAIEMRIYRARQALRNKLSD